MWTGLFLKVRPVGVFTPPSLDFLHPSPLGSPESLFAAAGCVRLKQPYTSRPPAWQESVSYSVTAVLEIQDKCVCVCVYKKQPDSMMGRNRADDDVPGLPAQP